LWEQGLAPPSAFPGQFGLRDQYPASEQVELRPALHLAFDQLEALDLSFRLAIGPRCGQRRFDGGPIGGDPVGQRYGRWQIVGLDIRQPPTKGSQIPRGNQLPETLPQCVAAGQLSVFGQHLLEHRLLVRVYLRGRPETEPAKTAASPAPGTRGGARGGRQEASA
jgi:hypothetical protein